MTPSEKQLGLLEAIVSDLADPKNLRRVKVKYPRLKDWLTRQPMESDWIPVLAPYVASGPVAPVEDDHVIIGFVNGDPLTPVVLGKIYSENKPPPG